MKNTILRPQLSIGWVLLLFVVAGPPIGAVLILLFAGNFHSFFVDLPAVALISYTVAPLASLVTAGLFWIVCRRYAGPTRQLTPQIGVLIGFFSGLLAMVVRSVVTGEIFPVVGMGEAASTSWMGSPWLLILVGAQVAAFCGLWSIYMSKP